MGDYFKDLHFEVASMLLSSIWNMDETNMCLEHKPANVVARKGAKTVPGRTSNSRETVTLLPCINAAGQKMPPLIIVKGKPQEFSGHTTYMKGTKGHYGHIRKMHT